MTNNNNINFNNQRHYNTNNNNNNTTNNTNTTSTVIQNPLFLSILITETAERVAYYGFRAILVLFFTRSLHFQENTAISLFALTSAIAYLSPLIGAILLRCILKPHSDVS